MIKDVTLGQYFPGKSIIHKLDPRVKVLLTLVNIVFIFIAGNFFELFSNLGERNRRELYYRR